MALQPISSLGIAGPLSGTMQPDNFGAPADWVPGNGPPPGMTWSETKGQWMPSNSVVGAMPGPNMATPISGSFTPLPTFAPGTDPINNFDAFGNPTQKSITTPPPDLGNVNLNDFATGGGRLNPLTGEFNAAGLGSPVGYDQFGQSLGYNPPSSPAPINQSFTPLPTFAPGMDPVKPDVMPQQQPYMPIMGGNQNVGILSPAIGQQPRPMNNPAPVPQQPAPTPSGGGLGSLLTPQRPVQAPVVNRPTTPPVNAGGLNSLIRPQTPVNTGFLGSTQPVTRNQVAPRAGSLPSLRIRPTFQRSLPVPFAKPPFRR